MNRFAAHLEILPSVQRAILPQLAHTPSNFILYGGTAIAMRIGHRESIDFDYFSYKGFTPGELLRSIHYLADAEVVQREANTLSALVTPSGEPVPVRLSFFGDLSLAAINAPEMSDPHSVSVASLLDLLGTKCATVTDRVEAKDYIDIHAILTRTELTLPEGLAAGTAIYGKQFNPLVTLKTLQYFEGGNLDTLSSGLKNDLARAVRGVELGALPRYPTRGLIGQKSPTS